MFNKAIFDRLTADATLTAMLATYEGSPAMFTTDPVPGNAMPPYIVCAGTVASVPFDTKTTRGRAPAVDVRCYAEANGSAVVVEAIADRVLSLLHRQTLSIDDFNWVLSSASGPVAADEEHFYGRVVSLFLKAEEK